MSGRTWEQIKEDEAKDTLARFSRLTLEQAQRVRFALVSLRSEPMTRSGHLALDYILEAIGELNHDKMVR